MPNRNFAWSNLPLDLLKALTRDLQLNSSDPAGALAAEYGTCPTDNFVLDAWESLRDRWLVRDGEASGGCSQRTVAARP